MLYERTIETSYKKLREVLDARYFVQGMTKFDSDVVSLQLLGYCVRDKQDTQWATVFEHKDRVVCEKVCQMLNEGEVTKC
jgi:hypothetical protein